MHQLLDQALITNLSNEAQAISRLRKNFNFHQLPDRVQRMLNAIEPNSYVRPHRHLNPPKVEMFIVLQGAMAVLIFNDLGQITHTHYLGKKYNCFGIDIAPGVWHSIISLESGTVMFETKDGPYIAATDKDFASWSPAEGSTDATHYLEYMRQQINS